MSTPFPASAIECRQIISEAARGPIDAATLNSLYAKSLLQERTPGNKAGLRLGETDTGYQRRLLFDWIQHSPYLNELTLENTQMKDPHHWVGTTNPLTPVERTKDGYGSIEEKNLFSPNFFYESLYMQYADKIDPKMIEELKKNRDWPLDRMDYGIVRDKKMTGVVESRTEYGIKQDILGKVVATLRVFNGIPARQIVVVGASGKTPLIIQRDPKLPFERVMAQRQITTKTSELLTQLRAQNPKAEIFEIGKLSVLPDHPDRVSALTALELFLLTNYLEKYPDANFYVHVNTRVHLVHYRRRYALNEIESVETGKDPVTGEPQMEWILVQKGSEIAKALRKVYEL